MASRKPIPGHPGYEADTDGNIWSRWQRRSLGGRSGTESYIGDRLTLKKTYADAKGYIVAFVGKRQRVHRLVLVTFVGPCPPGMQGCHNDGNPANNRLSNLRWDTPASNSADMIRHDKSNRGERHPLAKLAESEVKDIAAQISTGQQAKDVATQFGVSYSTARRIANSETWRHVLPNHDPRPHIKKTKPVKSPDALAAFANSHFFCQACGRDGVCTIHHIIGGRGGRSDEACNLLYACLRPCHLDFADHSRNLGVVLSMKFRAGELDQDGLDRLQELHGKRLPDLEPIPDAFANSYWINMRMRIGGAA